VIQAAKLAIGIVPTAVSGCEIYPFRALIRGFDHYFSRLLTYCVDF